MGRKIFRRTKKDLISRIKHAKKIILFLDYDGTLVPIRKKPKLAKISQSTKSLLMKLSKNPRVRIFIISGRSLQNIKSMVGIKSLCYIGNHGMELGGPGMNFVEKRALRIAPTVQKCCDNLKKKLKAFGGAFLENKHYTASLHYRLLDPRKTLELKKMFKSVIKEIPGRKNIKITEGKKVFEIRPNIKWDKGKSVNWILKKFSTGSKKNNLPICIGDDITDEDSFKVLAKKGIGILVSKNARKTFAQYRLESPKDVVKLLRAL